MDKLAEFYNDKKMREDVKKSLLSFLDKQIVKTVLSGDDVNGYKQAKDVYDKWLSQLAKEYTVQEAPKDTEYFNAE